MESWAGFGLELPTFVGCGEDEATENADGGPGNYVMGIMLVGFDAAVGDKGRCGIGWNSQFPSISLADEFGAAKRDGSMPGRKGLAPAVGSRFIHGVLEAVGDTFRDEKGPAELKRASEIPVAQS